MNKIWFPLCPLFKGGTKPLKGIGQNKIIWMQTETDKGLINKSRFCLMYSLLYEQHFREIYLDIYKSVKFTDLLIQTFNF
ncbi:hypothetical protein NIES2130_31335 [Scytonema sp. HK-05]|nr:hypothetical protein NIES2130_31335 [Scytonema sp. HK-05]